MLEIRVKYGEGVEFVCLVDQVFNLMVFCFIQVYCFLCFQVEVFILKIMGKQEVEFFFGNVYFSKGIFGIVVIEFLFMNQFLLQVFIVQILYIVYM